MPRRNSEQSDFTSEEGLELVMRCQSAARKGGGFGLLESVWVWKESSLMTSSGKQEEVMRVS